MEKVRQGFTVDIRNEEDAKEGFQEKVTVWIGSNGHGLPALSIQELIVLRDKLSEYIKKESHCSLCQYYWTGHGFMYCTKLQHRIKASRKNGCKHFKRL